MGDDLRKKRISLERVEFVSTKKRQVVGKGRRIPLWGQDPNGVRPDSTKRRNRVMDKVHHPGSGVCPVGLTTESEKV